MIMKPLPKANIAISVAHPGHELRLYGLLEQAKPFVWILTDGSQRTGMDMMFESVKTIDKAVKHGMRVTLHSMKDEFNKKIFFFSFPKNPEDHMHLKDVQIYEEIINHRTEFFISYIDFMVTNMIKYDTDMLVSDASEGTNVCHEMVRIMSDLAIKYIQKRNGKQIKNYQLSIDRPYDENLTDDTIRIELDDEQLDRKLEALLAFPLALTDLRPNISLDYNVIIEMRKMPDGKEQVKQFLKEMNLDFLRYEYLKPYTYSEPAEKPMYEINGEIAVAAGKYFNVITYKDHLKPLKEKLHNIIFPNDSN